MFKNKYKISRVNASKFFEKKYADIMTYEQAAHIARSISAFNNKPLSPEDILKNTKNYVFESHLEKMSAIVGVAQLKRKNLENCIIDSLIVDEPYRKQGYAKRLLNKIEEKAALRQFKKINALISEDNEAAIRLCKSCGFTKNIVYYNTVSKDYTSIWEKDVKKPCRKKKPAIAV